MNKTNLLSVILVASLLIISGCNNLQQNPNDNQKTIDDAPELLAGKESKYYEFNKQLYEQALKDNKIILLYFYANWCPICKEEQPKVFSAFNELDDEKIIGFRVNYKDSDTDKDEEMLAKEFQIPYQHTKVIIKDGKQVLKAPNSWSKDTYLRELDKVA